MLLPYMIEIKSKEQKEAIPDDHVILIIRKPKPLSRLHKPSCPSLNIIKNLSKDIHSKTNSEFIPDYPFPRGGKYFDIDPSNEDLGKLDVEKCPKCMGS